MKKKEENKDTVFVLMPVSFEHNTNTYTSITDHNDNIRQDLLREYNVVEGKDIAYDTYTKSILIDTEVYKFNRDSVYTTKTRAENALKYLNSKNFNRLMEEVSKLREAHNLLAKNVKNVIKI
jgi:hypothetical protein